MKVCDFIRKHDAAFLIILVMLCLAGCSLNIRDYFNEWTGYPGAILLEGVVLQGILALLCYSFIKVLGNNKFLGLKFENSIKDIYVIWPLALFSLINIAGNLGSLKDVKAGFINVILYVLTFVVTGIFEELLGRAAALKIFIKRFGNDKSGMLKAVIISNAVFGLVSFSSLITGQGGFLMCIVKYFNALSFGVLYAAIFLRTGSIWISVIMHVLFEITGSFKVLTINSREALDAMIAGSPMNIGTAILGIAVSIPFLIAGIYFLVSKRENMTS